MADIYIIDHDKVPVYTQYFDISIVPSTVYFFNGQHMKVDWGYVYNNISQIKVSYRNLYLGWVGWGTIDNTKYIAPFEGEGWCRGPQEFVFNLVSSCL